MVGSSFNFVCHMPDRVIGVDLQFGHEPFNRYFSGVKRYCINDIAPLIKSMRVLKNIVSCRVDHCILQ